MSVYHCALCDQTKDADTVLPYEWGSDWVCEPCHTEAVPEDWQDWEIGYHPWRFYGDSDHRWEINHKGYDGPEDPRTFTGPSLADVWAQAKEWNEENPDFYTMPLEDDDDWKYQEWKDRKLDEEFPP